MKNIDRLLFIPLFAAFAFGCSSPNSLQTSEYDDVYYSSKDKTIFKNTEVAAAVQDETEADAINTDTENSVPNPEYSQRNSGTAIAYDNDQDYYSQNYANDDDYYYSSRIRRFHTPYRGLSYYDFAYTDPYWYNRNAGYFGMRSYYDPFYSYDPFFNTCYSCFGYSPIYGGLTVMIGRPFYGGFGNGGLGYGGGFYNGYNRGFYNGFYNGYYANNGWYRNDTNSPRREQYGRRVDRSNVPTSNSNAGSNTVGRPSRNSGGGAIMPGGGGAGGGIARPTDTQAGTARPVRGRNTAVNTTIDPTGATQPLERENDSPARTTRRRVIGNDATSVTDPANQGATIPTEQSRPTRRVRVTSPETNLPSQGERVQINESRRRIEEGAATRTREYEPQRQERPAVQPRQERAREIYRSEPTYQAPARQERSYEQPSRPSYSPSGGSSSGDGNSGGGRGSRPRN